MTCAKYVLAPKCTFMMYSYIGRSGGATGACPPRVQILSF